MMRLEAPWALALLALLLPLIWYWVRQRRRPPAVLHADLSGLADVPRTLRVRLRHLPRVLRVLFLVLAVLALARPQYGVRHETISTFGVDIVVVLDRSGSMRALDFEPNRLEAAKQTIENFVAGRPGDRIGLVAFAKESYTACPLTLDHTALSALADDIDFAAEGEDGTSIGLGLASAVNRLRKSDATSRVVILVTDGRNNAGSIAPETAAELAAEFDIRVYTVGVGTRGRVPMPVSDRFGRQQVVQVSVEIDEEALTRIAERTGGRYFRADEREKMEEIFSEIDRMEKTEVTSQVHVAWTDRFEGLLLAAALALLLEVFVARPWLGRLP